MKALLVWTHDGAKHFANWLVGWQLDPIVVVPPYVVLLIWAVHSTDPAAITAVWAMMVALSPLWLPIGLFVVFWVTWVHYIRFAFWFGPICESVLLEIQLPPEVEKTPLAMETFFATLWNTGGETTFLQRVWRGQMRPVFSLEILSTEGQVRFYLHTRKVWRPIVEARLYGQFPEAQIREAIDPISSLPFNLTEYGIWGSEYNKKVPGGWQGDALPIRTYIDFQLDKSPDKPENSIDPITNIIELMGTLGKGEHFWFQLLIRGRKEEEWYGFYTKTNKYKADGTAFIKRITEGAIKRAQEFVTDPVEKAKVGSRSAQLMTEIEKRQVESIERSMTKLTYDCGIRVVYCAKREVYNGINNASIIRFFDTFNTNHQYTNRLGVFNGTTYFDYPWQDIFDIRQNKEKRNLYFKAKHRAYFGVPYDQQPVHLSSEEVATLWHFPSSVVKSPSIDRVPAKVSQAPTNLPV